MVKILSLVRYNPLTALYSISSRNGLCTRNSLSKQCGRFLHQAVEAQHKGVGQAAERDTQPHCQLQFICKVLGSPLSVRHVRCVHVLLLPRCNVCDFLADTRKNAFQTRTMLPPWMMLPSLSKLIVQMSQFRLLPRPVKWVLCSPFTINYCCFSNLLRRPLTNYSFTAIYYVW